MRPLLRRAPVVLAALALTLLGMLSLLALLALDGRPALELPRNASPDELAQVHGMLRRHDPRRAKPGAIYAVRLTGDELSLLTTHAARALGGASALQLGTRRLTVQLSLPLNRLPAGLWLNLDATLSEGPGLPHIDSLRIGDLSVPAPLARWLARRLLQWAEGEAEGEPLHRMVRQVSIRPDNIRLHYRWRADAPGQLFDRMVSPSQLARLRAYSERLSQFTEGKADPIELADLLAALAQTATARSADDATAVAENLAWLQLLALYVNGRSIATMLPAARDWPQLRPRPVMLNGRVDLPQHFVVSAWLAAEGGAPFADAVGLAKEMDDSRFGSGFSFTDVAANRAGRMFGTYAIDAPRVLQRALAQGVASSALMPNIADLTEYMPEREFVARYGGVGSAAYERVLTEIDARLAALALYR